MCFGITSFLQHNFWTMCLIIFLDFYLVFFSLVCNMFFHPIHFQQRFSSLVVKFDDNFNLETHKNDGGELSMARNFWKLTPPC
jgi:hypothetical protein